VSIADFFEIDKIGDDNFSIDIIASFTSLNQNRYQIG
jgi:hypothetical protein